VLQFGQHPRGEQHAHRHVALGEDHAFAGGLDERDEALVIDRVRGVPALDNDLHIIHGCGRYPLACEGS
jgi:hypothetical protein